MRYSPSLDPFSLERAPNPRPPNVRAVVRVKFPQCGKDSKERGTRTDTKGWKRRAFETFYSPLLFLSVLAARFIKIEGSSSVPLPSRKSAETSPYVSPRFPSFLPSFFLSLSNLSHHDDATWLRVTLTRETSIFERAMCKFFLPFLLFFFFLFERERRRSECPRQAGTSLANFRTQGSS